MMIDHSKFRSSLKRLEEQHANYRQGNPALSDLDREAVAESVIQRFETCYDCLWKVLKRHLTTVLGVPDAPNSPNPIFRLAHETTCSPHPWSSGSDTPTPASIRLMTTTATRRRLPSPWYRISSTTPSVYTRP